MNIETFKQSLRLHYDAHNVVYDPAKVIEILSRKRELETKSISGFSNDLIESQLDKMFNLNDLWTHEVNRPKAPSPSANAKPVTKAPLTANFSTTGKPSVSFSLPVSQSPALQFILKNALRPKQATVPVKMMMAYYCEEMKGFNYGVFTVRDSLIPEIQRMSGAAEEFGDEHGVSPLTVYLCMWDDVVKSIAN